jgi:adenosylcobinamide hydrolase
MNKFRDACSIPANGWVENRKNSVVVRFPGPRNVLSTSWLNGGYRTDLVAVFNHQISLEACEACHSGGNVREYVVRIAQDLGLDPASVSGLVTRAEMKNTAIVSGTFRDLVVTAVVTAGIDKNGGRAGDPASYYENGDAFEPVGGTINTILIIGADLPEHAMSRALITATEAKAATLQQLMARSLYSKGIATGSGTDMIAIVSDPGSPLRLTDAGKHSVLGELIGRTVIGATTEALELETGLSPQSQRNALVRLARFGITEGDLWKIATGLYEYDPGDYDKPEIFLGALRAWVRDPEAVARIAAALHILDEVTWGLLPEKDALRTIDRIMKTRHRKRPARHENGNLLDRLCMALVEEVVLTMSKKKVSVILHSQPGQ